MHEPEHIHSEGNEPFPHCRACEMQSEVYRWLREHGLYRSPDERAAAFDRIGRLPVRWR